MILLYHGVGPTSTRIDPGFLRVEPEAFRRQLEILRDGGFHFVTVAEFAERAAGGEPPAGLVALSFDDGMDDNHSVALPILREHGVPATVYVTTGLIGRRNPWLREEARARMMTVEELRDLVAAGWEIGAHSVTHPDLSRLDYDACLREVRESRAYLEEVLGTPVTTFAYPSCRYGPAAVAAVRAAGLAAAVTCQGLGSWSPLELQRWLVSGKDNRLTFVLKLAGWYEPLHGSAPSRLVRRLTRGLRAAARERRRLGQPS